MKVTAVEPPLPAVVIELSVEEAQAIMDVIGQVTGSMDGPRKHTEELWSKLKKIGYRWQTANNIDGTVRFTK